MKAILIDPAGKVVREVEHEGDYRDIKRLLNIESPIDAREIEGAGNKETLWFDDEFLCKMNEGDEGDFFVLNGVASPIGGRGLILGTNAEGESIATCLNATTVALNVLFKRLRLTGWTEGYTKPIDHPLLGKTTAFIGSQPIFEEVQ